MSPPPTAAQDAPPKITVGYRDTTQFGQSPPVQVSYTELSSNATIDMPTKASGHQIQMWAAAHNPGGVKTLKISLNNAAIATLTQTPDADGKVSPTIGIVGTDGSGGPGDQQITFTNTGANVVVVNASNFNGQSSHITITFVAHQFAP